MYTLIISSKCVVILWYVENVIGYFENKFPNGENCKKIDYYPKWLSSNLEQTVTKIFKFIDMKW